MSNFNDFLANEKSKCEKLLASFFDGNQTELYCPPNFDGYYCWPATPSLTLKKIRCALEKQKNESVYRWCSANTAELSGTNVTLWQDAQYETCSPLTRKQISSVFSIVGYAIQDEDNLYMMWWHEKFSILDEIGLGCSTLFLITALSIFARFSQLQDTRVKIHINLFIAMLLNAMSSLTQNVFYGCRIYYAILINSPNHNDENSIICRSLMAFSHYFELTTFAWILIEGWYFYSFISRAPYNDYVTIKPHVFAGWGLPLIVIIPWIIVHLNEKERNFCWVDNDLKINIMAIPILLIVLVNICFFILNVRIIFIKMRSTYMSQKRMDYWRWIKASLMLVPLFGTYDILYVTWPWVEDEQVKVWLLLIVRTICSFQGCFVSVLYCFTNNSVKKEIKRAWHNWQLKRQIESESAKRFRSSENLTKGRLSDQISQQSSVDFPQADFNNYF